MFRFSILELWPEHLNIQCCLQNMPDPLYARKSIWLPFMEKDLQIGKDDIIIGHSSGAVRLIGNLWEKCFFGSCLNFLTALRNYPQSNFDILLFSCPFKVAGIRYAETHKIFGLILVGAYSAHLNDEVERKSGYFDDDWEWEKVRHNCTTNNNSINIVQFGSKDDPFLPWPEQIKVAEGLKPDLKAYEDKGHFQQSTFPALVDAVKQMVISNYNG